MSYTVHWEFWRLRYDPKGGRGTLIEARMRWTYLAFGFWWGTKRK